MKSSNFFFLTLIKSAISCVLLSFTFFLKYLTQNNAKKKADNTPLIEYFAKYQAFCFDLSFDSVLKGKLNFKYR